MKNLVCGTLLAATSTFLGSGCIIESDDSIDVTATWTFKHIADGTARSCPVGFNTAAVIAQEVTPLTLRPIGSKIILMYVQIQNDSGSSVYAQGGQQAFIDTRVDSGFSTEILDDGGYFFLTWDLVDKASNAPLACGDVAGLTTSAGAVETVSTNVANTTSFKSDKFTCTDHAGTTSGLIAGRYRVSVSAAIDGTGAVSDSVNLDNKDINAPNGVTDLGHVVLPIN
jgi:hypothetical protein